MTTSTSQAETKQAKFVTGSTMKHILVMTSTASIGLMALFLVDLADMYFLSLLGEIEIAAAIGYAGSILFFTTSVGIGLSIAASALVARAIGEGDTKKAKRYALNTFLFAFLLTSVLACIVWIFVPNLLSALGAQGRAHELGLGYLQIIVPSMPIIACGMCCAGVMRALGDARRAMYITLVGGAINAVLDPIFIFTFELGVQGAALASVCSRVGLLAAGLYSVIHIHNFFNERTNRAAFLIDLPAIVKIAFLAILTNVATPVSNAYVTYAIAAYGDSVVAGWAVIGRIIPVAFGGIFALSGAVGPILGQNLGAQNYDRLRQALLDAVKFTALYSLIVWLILALLHSHIISAFNIKGEGAGLISLFMVWLIPGFGFMGLLFISNASFNNLGRPQFSTLFNWGRATLGTMPLIYIASLYYGAPGVLIGNIIGGVIFGLAGLFTCLNLISRIAKDPSLADKKKPVLQRRLPLWPFSTPRG